jgi:hypothetical protein
MHSLMLSDQERYATNSANPLSWALGQYVRLAQSTDNGTNLDTPQVVCRRYATCPGPSSTRTFTSRYRQAPPPPPAR